MMHNMFFSRFVETDSFRGSLPVSPPPQQDPRALPAPYVDSRYYQATDDQLKLFQAENIMICGLHVPGTPQSLPLLISIPIR